MMMVVSVRMKAETNWDGRNTEESQPGCVMHLDTEVPSQILD